MKLKVLLFLPILSIHYLFFCLSLSVCFSNMFLFLDVNLLFLYIWTEIRPCIISVQQRASRIFIEPSSSHRFWFDSDSFSYKICIQLCRFWLGFCIIYDASVCIVLYGGSGGRERERKTQTNISDEKLSVILSLDLLLVIK